MIPTWVASVEHREVGFGPLNEAARIQAMEEIRYPWNEPLVEVAVIRQQIAARLYVERAAPTEPDFERAAEAERTRWLKRADELLGYVQ